MSGRPSILHTFRFKAVALLASGAMIGALGTVGAQAAVIPGPGGLGFTTKFEIDGNKAGANDWDGGGYGPGLTPSGHQSTGIVAIDEATEVCSGQDPSMFPGSQKISGAWTIGAGNVNDKSNLCESGAAFEIVRVTAADATESDQQHIVLYQYWARSPKGTGDLTIYQVLEGPQPGRGDDFLLQFDYDSSGGGKITVSALDWDGAKWVDTQRKVYYDAAHGKIADGDETGTFGEAAVDLTASGLFPEDECATFTTGPVITRTGNSENATLQDFLKGPALSISNCGGLDVTKEVEGNVPDDLTFGYVVDQADGATVHDDTLQPEGVDTDESTASVTAPIGAGETHSWSHLLAQPDYRVQELVDDLPAGVTLDTIECSYTDLFVAQGQAKTVVLYENGEATGETFPIFPATLDAPAPSCTITNVATSLTLNKDLVNDWGGAAKLGDFILTATPQGGGSPVIKGADPSDSADEGITALVAPGSYVLTETQLAGYQAGAWSCTGATLVGNVVTIAARQNAVCTITNTDIPGTLTLLKDVTNTWGGTAKDTDFTLTATQGSTVISGAEGADSVTAVKVAIGDWVIGEQAKAGYTLTGVSCVGGTYDTDTRTVTIASGQHATCTVSNADLPGTLTLTKIVANDHGGTLTPEAWTLSADGATDFSGKGTASSQVIAGSYTLSETGPDGYAQGAWVCDGVTLEGDTVTVGNGDSVSCTITNSDIAPKLTLVKQVSNDHGGTAVATDWTLAADGPTPISGKSGSDEVSGVQVTAGAYTLSESDGPSGYLQGDWSCDTEALDDNVVTLGLGEDVTCTVINDDIAPKLTLVKQVSNDHGGTAVATDWTLAADGPTPISGKSGSDEVSGVDVIAGTYALSESDGPAGYADGDWSCVGGSQEGSSITLAPGDEATCTVINDDIAPKLTLIKLVTNDDGGTAEPGEWTLTATAGESSISGASGSDEVSGVEVMAGTYALSESDGPAGYADGDWSCVGGSQEGSSITLAPGDEATCTVVNDDIAPRLTLIKLVTNDDGGTQQATAWTLKADGPETIFGATGSDAVTGVDVLAGSYTLSESGPDGYAAEDWSCEGTSLEGDTVTLALDEDAVCTVVNDDIAPLLTLVKEVVNDNGGEQALDAWTLTAEGPTPISGITGAETVTGAPVSAGSYTLSESGPGGYTPGAWRCEGAVVEGASVTLDPGDVVTCTVRNDDNPVDLAVTKDAGGVTGMIGAEVDYTVTVRNVGDRAVDPDEPVTLVDVLPEYMTLAAGPDFCTAEGQVVTCELDPAELPVGGSIEFVLTVLIGEGAPVGVYTNMVVIDTEDDPAPENPVCPVPEGVNNVACEEVPVVGTTGLKVTKQAYEPTATGWEPSDGRSDFGVALRYLVTVTTTGTQAEQDVAISDRLDSRLGYVGAECEDHEPCEVSFDRATGTVSAALGDLAAGQSVKLWITVNLPAAPQHAAGTTYATSVPNVAMAESSESPRTPSNRVTTELQHTLPPVVTPTPVPPGLPSTGGPGEPEAPRTPTVVAVLTARRRGTEAA